MNMIVGKNPAKVPEIKMKSIHWTTSEYLYLIRCLKVAFAIVKITHCGFSGPLEMTDNGLININPTLTKQL